MAMIEIPCPNCDAALGRVDEAFRLFMFPHIACPCGFSGPFNWVNPRLGISVEEAISRLESRRNSSHIADTALHSESPAIKLRCDVVSTLRAFDFRHILLRLPMITRLCSY